MNETTGLKILLASGAALIAIAAAPTGAVDYAQCEAMMKIYTSIEVEFEAASCEEYDGNLVGIRRQSIHSCRYDRC